MKYGEYLEWVNRAATVDELAYIAEQVRRDKELTESQKSTLLSIHIGRKQKEIASELEIYLAQVRAVLENLPVTDELREVLDDYLTIFVPNKYTAISTMKKKVLPYIADLMVFLSKRFRRKVDVTDLDISVLKSTILLKYITTRSKSVDVQSAIKTYISVFGKWLESEGYVTKFPRVVITVPKKSPEKKAEKKMGQPRNYAELSAVFSLLTRATLRVPEDEVAIYQNFFRLLLASGMRPSHALMLRFMDFTKDNVEWVEDAFGRAFIKVASFKAVEREKELRGEKVTKKAPPDYIYISEGLYDSIYNYAIDHDWELDYYICPISLRSLQNKATRIARLARIPRFSLYDFRDTWASVLYNASGYNISIIVELGGWSSAHIPADVYIKSMSPPEAVMIAEQYEIYLPPAIEEAVKAAKEGVIPMAAMEQQAKTIEQMREMIRELTERLSRLEKERLK